MSMLNGQPGDPLAEILEPQTANHPRFGHAVGDAWEPPADNAHARATGAAKEPQAADIPRRWTYGELLQAHPTLKAPLIDGLVRVGETFNVVSSSKIGKSWLIYSLALSVVGGREWLGRFGTRRGKVLLIDNELHPETLANRIKTVGEAMAIQPSDYQDDLHVVSLRGNLLNVVQLGALIDSISKNEYALIIADAKYRLVPAGTDENSNSHETQFYNLIDHYAGKDNAAWGNVHHSTKGAQGDKRVTDVGAGGGAQSRATDCHLVLREHEDENVVVLEAAVRSFAPVEPLALKWQFPLWLPADDVDPGKLKGRLTVNEQRQQAKDLEAFDKITAAITNKGGILTERGIRNETGFSKVRVERLLSMMLSERRISTVANGDSGSDTTLYTIEAVGR